MTTKPTAENTSTGGEREDTLSRRTLFRAGLGGIAGAALATMGGLGNFLYPKVLFEPPQVFLAGRPRDYPVGAVNSKLKETNGVWIVRNTEGIYALVAICTHLGCSPNWFKDEGIFKCPCHGSNFNIEGDVIAGPAPEPLYRAAVKVNPFGQIVVDKAVQANEGDERESEQFVLRQVV